MFAVYVMHRYVFRVRDRVGFLKKKRRRFI